MSKGALEQAASVWWGEWIESDKPGLLWTDSNPETILIHKQMFTCLSTEAKDFLDIISDLPDEIFFSSGKLIWREANKIFRRKGWSWKRIAIVRKELEKLR